MSIDSNNSFAIESLLLKSPASRAESGIELGQSEQEKAAQAEKIQQVQSSEAVVDSESQKQVAEALLRVAQNLNQDIQFSLESSQTSTPVIQVVDRTSGDVIRQIPSEEFLQLAGRIQSLTQDEKIDSATGLLIDSRV